MTVKREPIEQQISKKQDEYIEMLFQLLRQPSISSEDIGVRECATLLKELMCQSGINAQVIDTEGHPIVFGEVYSSNSDFTLLIYGHYDVQPAEPVDEWLSPPFEPEIREGKIFARGAGDNKGQLMAQVLAVKTMLDLYGELPVNVKMVFDGEEENTSKNFEPFVLKYRELLKADLVYTSDGPLDSSGAPIVMLGCRGMLYLELTAEGAERDNHSGNKGGIVPNPAWKLIHLLHSMCAPDGMVKISGFYDQVRQPTAKELKQITKLPYDSVETARAFGLKTLAMDGSTYYRKLSLEPTFNISGLTSGYGGEGVKTIIPSKAKVKLDIRLAADQNPDDIYTLVKQHVEMHAPDVRIRCLGKVKPSRTSLSLDTVQRVIASVKTAYNQEPIVMLASGATFPDYVFTQTLGIPSVLVPYANADENNHAPNENMDVVCFFQGIKTTCQVLVDLGKIR
ncbi:M20/M25/M40 family metallo-hydrolase [Aneurinibacillus tyrosinisolvens]|uniref:M20/M25/M40 family metallo-hydrolase n=1 Tax=Aneurinibacillus tyrosinisolvens TaxID=1443435 RepID=UPI000AF68290|nr:M20/M25/M40 family metallo-hydrolase [Aneurinibacillus tyrosinisolvens]